MDGGIVFNCPLCRRGIGFQPLYGQRVCGRCYSRFKSRRQWAFLIDLSLVLTLSFYLDQILLNILRWGHFAFVESAYFLLMATPPVILFVLRDGFRIPSAGKLVTGLHVIGTKTRRPINLLQSLLRNAGFLVALIPYVGLLVFVIVALLDSMSMYNGYRWGDRLAGTQVIWKRYARHSIFGGDALACERCNYELVGNASGVCPECGTPVSAANVARLGA